MGLFTSVSQGILVYKIDLDTNTRLGGRGRDKEEEGERIEEGEEDRIGRKKNLF